MLRGRRDVCRSADPSRQVTLVPAAGKVGAPEPVLPRGGRLSPQSALRAATAPPPRGLIQDRDSKTVRAWAILRLLLALGVGWLPTFGWEEDPVPVPNHAYIDFGDHWRCDRGFERVASRCEEIRVPEHALLNRWGDGRRCERSFRRSSGRWRRAGEERAVLRENSIRGPNPDSGTSKRQSEDLSPRF